jgi:hypothetical protein
MKVEVQHKWRIKWCGKWTTTNHYCSEESIRKQHPEAQLVPNTRRDLFIPETPDEMRERMRFTDTSRVGSPAPGSPALVDSDKNGHH